MNQYMMRKRVRTDHCLIILRSILRGSGLKQYLERSPLACMGKGMDPLVK